jgi:ATP-dependent NAD(P)H-hydrate dehydratase
MTMLFIYRCVITPNAMEFSRLVDVVQADISQNILHDCTDGVKRSFYELLLQDLSSPDVAVNTRAVSIALGGVTVLRKAEHDVISSGSDVFILKESGSARRCGGQGDILAGCVSVALHWQNKVSIFSYVQRIG